MGWGGGGGVGGRGGKARKGATAPRENTLTKKHHMGRLAESNTGHQDACAPSSNKQSHTHKYATHTFPLLQHLKQARLQSLTGQTGAHKVQGSHATGHGYQTRHVRIREGLGRGGQVGWQVGW